MIKQIDPNVKHMDIALGPLYLWTHPGVQPGLDWQSLQPLEVLGLWSEVLA